MNYHTVTYERDDEIWSLVTSHAGETFHTARGLPFSYHQKISRTGEPLGELVIGRKEKTITRSTVLLAYEKALELMTIEDCVSGPKKLGCFGASYLYPVFLKLGICRKRGQMRNRTALTRIVKVLTGLDIVLGAVFVISILAAVAIGTIPSVSGMKYVYTLSGGSMYPTIQENAIVMLEEKPFDELQVGDIILFRHRADMGWEISISDEDMASGVAYKSFDLTGDSPKESYKDEGISYKDGYYTLHRIVEIREADASGDRALFTRGDNNPGNDLKTVMESGYVARVAWHLNYVGTFMRLMFDYKGLYWLIGICAALTIAVFVLRIKSEEMESSIKT